MVRLTRLTRQQLTRYTLARWLLTLLSLACSLATQLPQESRAHPGLRPFARRRCSRASSSSSSSGTGAGVLVVAGIPGSRRQFQATLSVRKEMVSGNNETTTHAPEVAHG
jgi:hypothetical protein